MGAQVPTGAVAWWQQARNSGLRLTAVGLVLLLGALMGLSILLRAPAPTGGGAQIATAAQAPDPSVASRTLVAAPGAARPALSELVGLLRGIVLCGLVAAIGAALLVLGTGRLRDAARGVSEQVSEDDPEEL